jgi:hypothetical protein
MHYGIARYVKVVNEDGASVTTKVAVKQHHYVSVPPRLKWLYLSEKTVKQISWHKEGKCDSEDHNIMSHPADSEAWEALDRFDPEFAWNPRVSALYCRQKVSNLTTTIVVCMFPGQFSSCLTICHPTNV